MLNKKIKVGVDFDGVIAYNPLRIVRAPITFVKRKILGGRKTEFYVPKNQVDRFVFWLPHQLSFFPAIGVELLRDLVNSGEVEAHLVSGRYNYLHPEMIRWLKWRNLDQVFTSLNINSGDEQPHLFKARVLKRLKLDYYIEDNLDIVEHLARQTQTRILWIYNILDRTVTYEHKFPYLAKALEAIKAVKK